MPSTPLTTNQSQSSSTRTWWLLGTLRSNLCVRLSSRTLSSICRFRLLDKTKTSRQRTPVQSWETINWRTKWEIRSILATWEYRNQITSLLRQSGSFRWILMLRTRPCQLRQIRKCQRLFMSRVCTSRATISTPLRSRHPRRATRAADADLEEDQKSKRI